VSFDGTMHLEADLEVPDALGLAQAVSAGAARLADLGSPTPSTGAVPPHSGTWPATNSPSASDDAPAARERRSTASAKPATQVVLHAHLTADAILRPDAGGGECLTGYVEQAGHRVLSADQIRDWCARPDVHLVVKPVFDLHQRLETAGYAPTDRIRDHVIARDRTCVFAWCGRNARRCDLDHVVPTTTNNPTAGDPPAPTTSPPVSTTPPPQDPWPLALPDDRPRGVRVDQPPRRPVPPRPHRLPTTRHRTPPGPAPQPPRPARPSPHPPTTDFSAPHPADQPAAGHRRVHTLDQGQTPLQTLPRRAQGDCRVERGRPAGGGTASDLQLPRSG
jgi:hypothetical protein